MLLALAVGLVGIFIALSLQITGLMEEQTIVVENLSQVEYLSSSTQRAAKNVNSGFKDNKVIYYIKEQTYNILDSNSPDCLYLMDDEEIKSTADKVLMELEILLNLFETSEEDDHDDDYDIIAIVLTSDNHFNNMTDLSLLITEHANLLGTQIEELQKHSYTTLFVLGMLVGILLFVSAIEVQTSKKLTYLANIDAATGLNNRSQCQEVLKDTAPTGKVTQSAVIVIDLNDLKLTNDQQGHQIGDELISSFANLLSTAAEIHKVLPFLGRYGGDEFVVYYSDVENKEEVERFITELSNLAQEFNKHEDRKFAISYALGYAIDNDGLSARKLFEQADETMYENKKMIKKRKSD